MASFENTNRYVKFVRGTQNAWNKLTPEQIHEDTLYFIYESSSSNTGTLYLGNKKISSSGEGTDGDIYLKDLKDVLLSNINNSEILVYNNGKWINNTIEDILNFDNNVLELDNEGSLTLRGFNSASVGTIPQKDENGSISWVKPEETAEVIEIKDQISNIQEGLKSTVTESEVKTLITEEIAKVDHLSYEKVESLEEAEANPQPNKIYLVPAEESENNKYDEYMVIDGTLELVGSWSVDLEDYVTVNTFNTVVGNLEELIDKNVQDISALSGLIATASVKVETLNTEFNNFKSVVGDLSAFTAENTLAEQVDYLTKQLEWQEIAIEE